VFVSIWKRRKELDIKGTVIAYLLRSARNLSIRAIEKNNTRQRFIESLSEYTRHLEQLPEVNKLELYELEARVNKAIDALPSKMREVYLLSRMENLSYRDISRQLGIAETTVKKQVSNALKSIKTEIGGLSATALLFLVFLGD
jgi:RNA polymerase sigma-70 factor (ECF subfamily)